MNRTSASEAPVSLRACLALEEKDCIGVENTRQRREEQGRWDSQSQSSTDNVKEKPWARGPEPTPQETQGMRNKTDPTRREGGTAALGRAAEPISSRAQLDELTSVPTDTLGLAHARRIPSVPIR